MRNQLILAVWGFEFDTKGQLRAGLFISLLSVWLLVGVFSYLNLYTRRKYFSIWTMGWLFYALFLTISYSSFWIYGSFSDKNESWWALMLKQWCISTAAVSMFWGGMRFLGRKVRQVSLALFLGFLFFWSFVASYPWPEVVFFRRQDRLSLQMPIFILIGCSSLVTVWGFFQYRRKRKYKGAGLLSFGFLFWGLFVAAYPLMERLTDYMSTGFFVASVLQMFIAVNMIIVVLEQIRYIREKQAAWQLKNKEHEKTLLRNQIILTEKRYRLLFEQSSEPIVITNCEDLHVVGLNQAAARVLGVSRAEACQYSLFDWIGSDRSQAAGPASAQTWFDSLCHNRIQAICRKDGRPAQVEVVGSVVDFAGETAFQFYLREVTERSRLEQQLRHAEKLSGLGQMISGVVHELNNPLTVACGFVDLSLMDPNLPAKHRDYLRKAGAETQRAARLLRNFLNLAREGGAEKSPLDLNEIVRSVTELRRADFRHAQVELTLDLCSQLPQTCASSDQVQQILIILINNAIHAMATVPTPRKLRLATLLQTGGIGLQVEDNGPGVPPDLRSKIFEPFFTTKPVGVGTGLGLSLAHSFAMEHHGRICCDESSLGGARFNLLLPVDAANPPEPLSTPLPTQSPRLVPVA
jgi:PAS domain S-box-containing protein